MSELDEKLNSILSNPAMMQQIMSLAQSLNQQSQPEQPQQQTQPAPQKPSGQESAVTNDRLINPNLLSRVATLMQRGSIDKNQESLLRALRPYLSKQKLDKLERAMHAAKMAGIATEMVNTRGQSPFSRR